MEPLVGAVPLLAASASLEDSPAEAVSCSGTGEGGGAVLKLCLEALRMLFRALNNGAIVLVVPSRSSRRLRDSCKLPLVTSCSRSAN